MSLGPEPVFTDNTLMSDSDAEAIDDRLFWEDFPVGETIAFGRYEMTRAEITGFAAEFDPQPFHLEDEAAADSLLGGLAASGWHTCGALTRMICDEYLCRSAGLGSPGVDEIKWLKPVRPGDVLTARRTCLETRPSASRPEMGLCKFHIEAINQSGAVAMTWVMTQLFFRRDHGSGEPGDTTR